MFVMGRVFEIIRNLVCYLKLNVKICVIYVGFIVGEDGVFYESVEDIVIMRVILNMIVFVLVDGVEIEKIIFEIVKYNGFVYVRLGRSLVLVLFDEDYKFEIGKGIVLREGKDVLIIVCGIMVNEVLLV